MNNKTLLHLLSALFMISAFVLGAFECLMSFYRVSDILEGFQRDDPPGTAFILIAMINLFTGFILPLALLAVGILLNFLLSMTTQIAALRQENLNTQQMLQATQQRLNRISDEDLLKALDRH